MATNEQLKLTIEVAAKNAVRELQATAREAKNVGDAVEEIDPKAVARSFDAATDMLIADLRASEAAVDALGLALGPELRAKIGDAGLDKFIGDLKQTGLTFDQIEQNADDFAASLKKMDGAAASVKNVEGKLKAMNERGDNSRSVLANMVGNSAQDLGALTGVAGSAGVAIGQLAEYAADGNVSLKGLAKVAGPLAGVGVAMWALSKGAEQAAKRSADFEDAIRNLSRASDEQTLRILGDAMMRAVLEGEKLEDQFRDIAEGNIVGAKRLVDVALAAGYTEENLKLLTDAITEKEEADRRGEANTTKYGDAVTKSGDAAKAAKGPYRQLIDATADFIKVQQDAEQATRDANDAMLAKIDTDFAAYDAQQSLIEAGQELAEVKDDEETAVNEVDQAQKNYVRSAIDAAAAIANQAEAQAIANGKTMDAKTKNDLMIESLMETAKTLDPKSPVRKMLDQYIAALLKIPPDISTALSITGAGMGTSNRPSTVTGGGTRAPDGERTRSAPAPTVNVTVNTAADPRAVVEAINKYVRQGGRLQT